MSRSAGRPRRRARARALPASAARTARGRLGRAAGTWLLAVVAATSCTPLYLPPVPRDLLSPAPAWRVAGETALEVARDAAGRPVALRLRLRFDEVPAAAWVAVQWFAPTGGERASDARWIEPADAGGELTWDSPADLALIPGRWRAVLSVGERLLRQFDVEVDVP